MFQEASFSELIILGENIVVDIAHTTVNPSGGNFTADQLIGSSVKLINQKGGLSACVQNGYDSFIQEYDKNGDGDFDLVCVFLRNTYRDMSGNNFGTNNGIGAKGTGFTKYFSAELKDDNGIPRDFGILTCQGIGPTDQEEDVRNPVIHEIGHQLFGNNGFHAGGGSHNGNNQAACFMGHQGGYGLMGGSRSSLVSTNGFERWRLNWRGPGNQAHRIAASGVNTDIDQSNGAQSFLLRDFVTYGDAIRIRLPYQDTDASNQYIWLENHQTDPTYQRLDYFHESPGSCRPDATPGIYAYYQIGKDVLSSIDWSKVWPNNQTDNLKMITAEGYFDISAGPGTIKNCVSWGILKESVVGRANPLSGAQDQAQSFDGAGSSDLTPSQILESLVVIRQNGKIDSYIPQWGDPADAFIEGGVNVMDIGTNPAPVNTLTSYHRLTSSKLTAVSGPSNDHTYLTGLRIHMEVVGNTPEGKIYRVNIRWDDYDVKQDVRWCSQIILPGAEEVHLLEDREMLLDQGRNPYQKKVDPVSGTYFPPTTLTCQSGSLFEIQAGAEVILREQSQFTLEDGATLVIRDEGILRVEAGCLLTLLGDVQIEGVGRIIIECDGQLCVHGSATLLLEDHNSLILIHAFNTSGSSCLSANDIINLAIGYGHVHVFDLSNDLTVSNETYPADDLEAGRSIEFMSNNQVQPLAKLWAMIQKELTLVENFEVQATAAFEIIQADCNP